MSGPVDTVIIIVILGVALVAAKKFLPGLIQSAQGAPGGAGGAGGAGGTGGTTDCILQGGTTYCAGITTGNCVTGQGDGISRCDGGGTASGLNCPPTCKCINVSGKGCVCENNSNCPCSPCNTSSTSTPTSSGVKSGCPSSCNCICVGGKPVCKGNSGCPCQGSCGGTKKSAPAPAKSLGKTVSGAGSFIGGSGSKPAASGSNPHPLGHIIPGLGLEARSYDAFTPGVQQPDNPNLFPLFAPGQQPVGTSFDSTPHPRPFFNVEDRDFHHFDDVIRLHPQEHEDEFFYNSHSDLEIPISQDTVIGENTVIFEDELIRSLEGSRQSQHDDPNEDDRRRKRGRHTEMNAQETKDIRNRTIHTQLFNPFTNTIQEEHRRFLQAQGHPVENFTLEGNQGHPNRAFRVSNFGHGW